PSISSVTGILNVAVMVASFVSVGYNVLFLLYTCVTKITREPINYPIIIKRLNHSETIISLDNND
ncbi:hypothetical protein, partial [Candidatus Parabeggiatoa sp. HSG14]|uniref:hypothetical protein n=1 Tax=Candidatus Parabeggiatoa sp. HSG14 TaxID=3055593 RepID=UPI0025A92F71|nr:hypothetical protein [Thiotrichales bacterium HSG14]